MSLEDHEQILGDEEQNDSEFENSEFENSEVSQPPSFDPRDYHPQRQPDRVCTGPRTPEGKAISSQNATKHGCRSNKLVLRHENPDEYEALFDKWWEQYQPQDHAEETLVEQLVNNHWLLKRATLRVEEIEWENPLNPRLWTDSHHRKLALFTRYKTAAERAFHKSFRVVQMYFRDSTKAEVDAFKAETMRMKVEAEIARKGGVIKPDAKPIAPQTGETTEAIQPLTASETPQTQHLSHPRATRFLPSSTLKTPLLLNRRNRSIASTQAPPISEIPLSADAGDLADLPEAS
jgi:hypothetical protein